MLAAAHGSKERVELLIEALTLKDKVKRAVMVV